MHSEKDTHSIRALKAHVALNVRDVAASVAFYQKLFGIAPCKVRTGYAKFDVANPPINFTLNENHFAEGGALSHMGVQLASTDEVLAKRTEMIEAGLTVRDEMQVNCCYAIQDKFWVVDPDGNEWEHFVVLEDNLAEQASDTACCTVPAAPVSLGRGARSEASLSQK
jgi:catechol 2,3-dioxygenase-like lactoylglutathione lyase family enzyme